MNQATSDLKPRETKDLECSGVGHSIDTKSEYAEEKPLTQPARTAAADSDDDDSYEDTDFVMSLEDAYERGHLKGSQYHAALQGGWYLVRILPDGSVEQADIPGMGVDQEG